MKAAAPFRNEGVLIGNGWQTGEGEALTVVNPVTGETVISLASASLRQVDEAVQAAQRAFQSWRHSSAEERGALLYRMAAELERQRPRLEAIQQLNNGKPAFEASLDVSDAVATFGYYAGLCRDGISLHPQNVPLPDDGISATQEHLPVGVVALIVPWNFPLVTAAWKLAPALAAGCTVVLKPSELTPLAEIALMECLIAAGLPPGVVNLVTGAGAVGQALATHATVSKVSFTGSNAVGQRILQSSGPRMQRVSLELGGKSALIVLDDAYLEKAIELACGGAFFNAGQMCSATSRVLVDRGLFKRFQEGFVTAAQALKHGNPADPTTTLGPLISHRQRDSVLERMRRGIADGASLLTGGHALPALGGFAVEPTVFVNADQSPALWHEEVFGPVACLHPFDSDDEAIALSNDSDFGLVASVVSGDASRARRVASALDAGTVWINTPQLIFPQTSWGGFKHSSLGRELGPWGLRSFQELRHVLAPR